MEAVTELCRDYDTINAAIEAEALTDKRQELMRLAEVLAEEMLERLSEHQDLESGGCAS